jgi:N-acetylglutamate synthase-like GNAT family acetyltransferase
VARRELAGGFELDDDPQRVDVDAVHAFISEESYWGRGRPRELVERAIRGSARVVGLYRDGAQIGFARAASDGAIVAYLADVYVLAPYRGRGLAQEMLRELIDNGPHAELTWLLHTEDAQGLYAKLGFVSRSVYPVLERRRPKVAGEAPYEDEPGDGEDRPGSNRALAPPQ